MGNGQIKVSHLADYRELSIFPSRRLAQVLVLGPLLARGRRYPDQVTTKIGGLHVYLLTNLATPL